MLLACIAVGVRQRILRVVQVNFESRSGWAGRGVGGGGWGVYEACSQR